MTDAYRCDECGEFHEGRPALRVSVSLDVNGKPSGMLGKLFNASDGGDTVDLCGVECYQRMDLNAIRDEMLAEMDNKEQLLNAESTVDVMNEMRGEQP